MLLTFGEVYENPRFSSPVTYMIIQNDGTQLLVHFLHLEVLLETCDMLRIDRETNVYSYSGKS